MIKKEPGDRQGRVSVTCELPASTWAGRVNLVGELNNWDTMATPMTRR